MFARAAAALLALWVAGTCAAAEPPAERSARLLAEARGLTEQGGAGALERALPLAEESARLRRELGDTAGEADSTFRAGLLASRLGEKRRALVHYLRARELRHSLADRAGESQVLNNLGVVHDALGDKQAALDAYTASLELKRALKDRKGEAVTLANIGLLQSFLGDQRRALATLQEALAIKQAERDEASVATTLSDIGQLLAGMNRPEEARRTFDQALAMARSLSLRNVEASTLNRLGRLNAAAGTLSVARRQHGEALAIYRALGDPKGEAYSLQDLGEVAQAEGDEGAARAQLEEALALRRAMTNPSGQARTLASLAELAEKRGALEVALALIEESLALTESLRAGVASQDYRTSFLASSRGRYELELRILLALHDASPTPELAGRAFRATERARARALVEAVAEAGLTAELPPDLAAREERMESAMARLQREVRDEKDEARKKALLAQLTAQEDAWTDLRAETRRRRSATAALRDPQPAGVEEVRRILAPGEALLSYWLGRDTAAAFVLTRERLSVVRLAIDEETRELLEVLPGLVAGDARRWQGLVDRVAGRVVSPCLPFLAQSPRLVLVPDGALSRLPFEALRLDGHALLARRTVSYAPSATLLALLRSFAGAPAPDILVLADPVPPPPAALAPYLEEGLTLPRLRWSAAEARAVSRFGGPGTRHLAGREASERTVKETDLSRYGVLHFATHGLVSLRAPLRSALLLSSDGNAGRHDGLLSVREILRLRLASPLVVLSACGTARGRLIAGEGVQGLAQAFLQAGARAVVATLWEVSDRRTAALMTSFYAALASGANAADALRTAKLELLAGDPEQGARFAFPYVLIGDGQVGVRLPGPGRRPLAVWVSVGLVAALLGLALLWRLRSVRR